MACDITYNKRSGVRELLIAARGVNPNITQKDFLNLPHVKNGGLSKSVIRDIYRSNQITNPADIALQKGWKHNFKRAIVSNRAAVNYIQEMARRAGFVLKDSESIRDLMTLQDGKIIAEIDKIRNKIFGKNEDHNNPSKDSWMGRLNSALKEANLTYVNFKDYVIAKHVIERNERISLMEREAFDVKRDALITQYVNADSKAAKTRIKNKLLEHNNTEADLGKLNAGMTTEDANAIISKGIYKGKENVLRDFYQEFNQVANIEGRLEPQRGNRLTDEQIDDLSNGRSKYNKWEWYVPLEVQRDVLIAQGVLENNGRGGTRTGAVKGITGSTKFKISDRYDPFAVSMVRSAAAIENANRNKSIAGLGELLAKIEDTSSKVRKLPLKPKIDAMGDFVGATDVRSAHKKNNSLYFHKDGALHVMEFNAEPNTVHPVVQVFNKMPNLFTADYLPDVVSTTWNNIQKTYSKLFTSANPFFGPINFIRDFQDVSLNIESIKEETGAKKLRRKYWANIPKAYAIATTAIARPSSLSPKQKAIWDSFVDSGSPITYRKFKGLEEDIQATKELMDKLSADNHLSTSQKPLEIPLKGLRTIIRTFEGFNDIFEVTNRLALYETLRNTEGISDQKAAAEARRTMDFNERADMTSRIGSMYMFFNAGVRGIDRAIETLNKNKPLAAKMMGGLTAMGFLSQMMSQMSGDENCPTLRNSFKRDNYTILPIPFGKDCDFVTIPKPYSVFRAPFSLGEDLARVFYGVDEFSPSKLIFGLFNNTIKSLDPVGAIDSPGLSGLAPTLTRPLVQTSQNRKWSGSELVPGYWASDDSKPFYEKTHGYDSKIANDASKFLYNNIDAARASNPNYLSPIALDYLFNSYLNVGLLKDLNKTAVGDKFEIERTTDKGTKSKGMENIIELAVETMAGSKINRVDSEAKDDMKLRDDAVIRRLYSDKISEKFSLSYALEDLLKIAPDKLTKKQYEFYRDNIDSIKASRRTTEMTNNFNKIYKDRLIELGVLPIKSSAKSNITKRGRKLKARRLGRNLDKK